MTLKWNPDLRPPRYYGHFFWPPGKNDHTFSCTETLVSTVTSLLQPNFFGPLVAVLTGFHCICLRSQWIESLRLRIVESSYIPYDYIHRSSRYNFHSLDTTLKKQQPFKKNDDSAGHTEQATGITALTRAQIACNMADFREKSTQKTRV